MNRIKLNCRTLSFALFKSESWKLLIKIVLQAGRKIKPKFKDNIKEIQRISFEKNGYPFKGSEVNWKSSFENINKQIIMEFQEPNL